MTTNHGLQKIDSRGIGDEITIQLVQLVTNSEPGTRLPTERELSDMLNVSRSSIREAVRSLAFVGAVRVKQGDGIYVADTNNGDIERLIGLGIMLQRSHVKDIIEARQVLEADVAALAAQRHTEENREALEQVMAKLIHDEDQSEKVAGLDLEFHVALAQATHNSVLMYFVNGMRAVIRSWIESKISLADNRDEVIHEIITEHTSILEAVFNRDEALARQRMHDHMERSAERLNFVLESRRVSQEHLLYFLKATSQ